MKTRDQSRLASLLTLLIGVWAVLSPIWISVSGGALASVIITGLVIVAASAVQYFWNNIALSWVIGIAAAWLFLSALLYSISAGAAWSQILSAVAIGVLAYWDGIEVTHLEHDNKHHHATPAM